MKDYILIPLTQGYYAMVDNGSPAQYHTWRAHIVKGKNNTYIYGRRSWYENGKCRSEYLHRFVKNAPADKLVDHKNHNGLDCREENLRVCSRSQNATNTQKVAKGKSGVRGVRPQSASTYRAVIKIGGKNTHIGTFKNIEDAARAYDAKAKEIHGEFAVLNFPEEVKAAA